MDGNVRCFTISGVTFTLTPLLDVILAAADVEGNFLVVKVRRSSSALRVNRLNPYAGIYLYRPAFVSAS